MPAGLPASTVRCVSRSALSWCNPHAAVPHAELPMSDPRDPVDPHPQGLRAAFGAENGPYPPPPSAPPATASDTIPSGSSAPNRPAFVVRKPCCQPVAHHTRHPQPARSFWTACLCHQRCNVCCVTSCSAGLEASSSTDMCTSSSHTSGCAPRRVSRAGSHELQMPVDSLAAATAASMFASC